MRQRCTEGRNSVEEPNGLAGVAGPAMVPHLQAPDATGSIAAGVSGRTWGFLPHQSGLTGVDLGRVSLRFHVCRGQAEAFAAVLRRLQGLRVMGWIALALLAYIAVKLT